ncbi:MAG TPA: hypothetical protein VJ375_05310, partial [Gaiellaceae bacterium]|nr:hypothetical protein [Gaiellaceae bacterium]
YAAELLADGRGSVGYLLKDRILDVDEFVDTVRRVAAGGTALDPDVVRQLVTHPKAGPLDDLSPRERNAPAWRSSKPAKIRIRHRNQSFRALHDSLHGGQGVGDLPSRAWACQKRIE